MNRRTKGERTNRDPERQNLKKSYSGLVGTQTVGARNPLWKDRPQKT